MLKKDKLRYNEYYDMQSVYDELYQQSRNNNNFYKLIEIIGSRQNIRLAYKNLRGNSGSHTKGTDGLTIEDIGRCSDKEMIDTVRGMLSDYKPKAVRRVLIPKPGSDKKRPLGIPCIWDRLVQQCILQVLEPICEPKFHNHSYGFRPNRSAHHALSRMVSLINLGRHYYCVDVDIKGFFDNVNHGKLLKQIWGLGIRDKRLISIIGKLLKSEIQGEGIPTKGTPQGGIISPLLSNIVLNELDWWVSDQWETYKPRRAKSETFHNYAHQYTNLKDGYIVRYADDFKIMCRTYAEAQRFYYAVVDFLKNRLDLDISPEKSKVTNLQKNSSEFLGFKIKVLPKKSSRYGYIAKTDMCNKAFNKVKANIKNNLKDIQMHTVKENIIKYNNAIIGAHNYYCVATNVYNNFDRIDFELLRTHKNRLRNKAKRVRFSEVPKDFQKFVQGVRGNRRIYKLMDMYMVPIVGVHHKSPMNFSQDITDYSESGRKKIHSNQKAVSRSKLRAMQLAFDESESVEFRSNAVSRFVAQYGKCYVTGEILEADESVAMRIKPKSRNGTDDYSNIIIVSKLIAQLISDASTEGLSAFDENQKKKINKFRRGRKLKLVN